VDVSHCCTLVQHIINANSVANTNSGKVILINVILIFLLILINGFFASSEMAIVRLNETKIRAAAEDGDEVAKKLLPFLENQGGFLATVQVGVTIAGFLSAAFGANQITPIVYNYFDPNGIRGYLQPIITVLITIIISYFSLVLGELVPKHIAMRDPEKHAKRYITVLRVWDKLVSPFANFLNASAKFVCRIIGIDLRKNDVEITEEEILLMTRVSGESGGIQSDEAKMIYNVFDLDDTEVSEIMTPRTAMITLPADSTYKEVVYVAAHERYSRIPVFEDNVDNIIGILHIKDLLRITLQERDNFDLRRHLREAYFVPEGKSISVLFREMQQQNISLAIVIDEYGGTDGLIAIEDILEEIVGDIADEYDGTDQSVVRNPDGSYILDGLLSPEEVVERVAEVPDLGNDDNFDYDTLAGLVLSRLERIPEPYENPSVIVDHYKFTVLEMDDKRIARVKLEFLDPPEEDQENSDTIEDSQA
jgi:putative hemolysin